jgi:hypothetical protein
MIPDTEVKLTLRVLSLMQVGVLSPDAGAEPQRN